MSQEEPKLPSQYSDQVSEVTVSKTSLLNSDEISKLTSGWHVLSQPFGTFPVLSSLRNRLIPEHELSLCPSNMLPLPLDPMELAGSSNLTANLPIAPEIEPAVKSLEPNPPIESPQQLDKANSSTKGRRGKEIKRDVVAMLLGADIFLPIDDVVGAFAADY